MPLYLEINGATQCVKNINVAIQELHDAASSIDAAMAELPTHWQGAAADKVQRDYADQYQTLIKTTVPEALKNFSEFIQKCNDTIIDIDRQLSGQ